MVSLMFYITFGKLLNTELVINVDNSYGGCVNKLSSRK